MRTLTFTFDEEANGWLSEPFEVIEKVTIHIELSKPAPVVTLKQEADGEFAVYGQTPQESDNYDITLTTSENAIVKMAAPVEVTDCYTNYIEEE